MVARGRNEMRARRRRALEEIRRIWLRDDEEGEVEEPEDEVESDHEDDPPSPPASPTAASVQFTPPASATSTSVASSAPPLLTPPPQTTPPLLTPTPKTTSSSTTLTTSSTTLATVQSPIQPPVQSTPLPTPTTTPTPVATPFESLTSSLLTAPSMSTLTSAASATTLGATGLPQATSASSIIFIGQQNGDQDDDHDRIENEHHDPPHNNQFAIAFGVLGAVGFLVGLIWAALLIRRRRRKHHQDQPSTQDYVSGIGRSKQGFKLPSWPFSRRGSSSSSSFSSSSPSSSKPRRSFPRPFSSNKLQRSDASIMDEAIRAAYGTDDSDTVPRGFLDEKRHDPDHPLPLLEPEPILQASIRQSLVSWFKRSSHHHPLKLNSMSRWSRSSRASTAAHSEFGGFRPTSRYTDMSSMRDSVPPVPPLRLNKQEAPPPPPPQQQQQQYTGASSSSYAPSSTTARGPPTPGTGGPVELPVPEPVLFTRDDAQAYFKTILYRGEADERLSTASSWTDATRSTMRASAGPATAGLTPPPTTFYGGDSPSRRGTNLMTPITDYTTSVAPSSAVEGGSTAMREELYKLYASVEDGEHGGLGLQRFETMGRK